MSRGKQTCSILKDIRRQIAEANDIEFITSECQFKGDCTGTCPKCEAEVRYLEQQLYRRQIAGKAITILGLSAGMLTMNACGNTTKPEQVNVNDSIDRTQALFSDEVEYTDSIDSIPQKVVHTLGYAAPIQSPAVEPDTQQAINENIETTDLNTNKIDIEDEPIEGDAPFEVIESMPEFLDGGTNGLYNYIAENLKYPNTESDIEGRILVSFTVKKDGSIGDAKIRSGLTPFYDQEVLRVINSMPKWKPGMQRGKPVEVKYTIPIKIKKK